MANIVEIPAGTKVWGIPVESLRIKACQFILCEPDVSRAVKMAGVALRKTEQFIGAKMPREVAKAVFETVAKQFKFPEDANEVTKARFLTIFFFVGWDLDHVNLMAEEIGVSMEQAWTDDPNCDCENCQESRRIRGTSLAE